MTEDKIQQSAVDYLRVQYPKFITFAVPNGSHKSFNQARIARETGLLAGIPDLGIMMPHGHIVWVEMKTKKGTLTDSQKELFPVIRGLGFEVHVCRSLDDVIEVMKDVATKQKIIHSDSKATRA